MTSRHSRHDNRQQDRDRDNHRDHDDLRDRDQRRLDQGSLSSRDSRKSKVSNDSGVFLELDPDFVPVKVRIYRNGDAFDTGTDIAVTRREFKHWFAFLDYLSKRIRSLKTVQKLHSLNGDEVVGFDELSNSGQYVACADVPFKQLDYGKSKPLKWTPAVHQMAYRDPLGIDSHESLEMHLKKLGFISETGTTYPDDNPDNHKRGKKYPRRIIVPRSVSRRGSRVQLPSANSNNAEDKEKSSFSLPKINTSGHLTVGNDNSRNRPRQSSRSGRSPRHGSDPELYSSRRRHKSESSRDVYNDDDDYYEKSSRNRRKSIDRRQGGGRENDKKYYDQSHGGNDAARGRNYRDDYYEDDDHYDKKVEKRKTDKNVNKDNVDKREPSSDIDDDEDDDYYYRSQRRYDEEKYRRS